MELSLTDNLRTRASAFSYQCHACNKCCHGKGIQVNPYETMRLSGNLGITTTEFRKKYLNQQILKHKPDSDACIFLGKNGCTVHKDRPLACRLYPLGRVRLNDGKEIYPELLPHPESEGEYGTSSTVDGYLQNQEVERYLQAEESYREVIIKMANAALNDDKRTAKRKKEKKAAPEFNYSGWILDPDPIIIQFCVLKNMKIPVESQQKLDIHIMAIAEWTEGEWEPNI